MSRSIIHISPELEKRGIGVHLLGGILKDFNNNPGKYNFKDNVIHEVKEYITQNFSLKTLKDQEIVSAYRSFYWDHLGIDPTKERPAGEALTRRILHKKGLYKINYFVDGYNWASAYSRIPISAYDLDHVEKPLLLRFADKNESFKGITGKNHQMDGNELVLCDAKGKILTQFPFRDASHSKITKKTQNILIVVLGIQNIPEKNVNEAFEKILENLRSCETKEKPEITVGTHFAVKNY